MHVLGVCRCNYNMNMPGLWAEFCVCTQSKPSKGIKVGVVGLWDLRDGLKTQLCMHMALLCYNDLR